jgi:hypothetical protein
VSGALSTNRLFRSEYPPSPTSTTVEFQSSSSPRSSFCSPHSLFRPHCQVRAVSPTPSYPYWLTLAGGSGLAVTTDTAQIPCPSPPGSEGTTQGRSAGCLARHIFGGCPVSWDGHRLYLACRKEEGKNLHVRRAKVCKRAIHPCCRNYQNDQSGSLKYLCCRRHIKSKAFTTR